MSNKELKSLALKNDQWPQRGIKQTDEWSTKLTSKRNQANRWMKYRAHFRPGQENQQHGWEIHQGNWDSESKKESWKWKTQ
jgi:hypothetical protein